MNIESLYETIKLFEQEIIESGFYRNIQDYLSSLPNNQNNIIALRDIAEKISSQLATIYSGDLPESLRLLFPGTKEKPFTDTNFYENSLQLINDIKLIKMSSFQNLNNYYQK